MSLQGRLERAYKAEVEALKGQLGERTWDLGVSEEKRQKLAAELASEKERAQAREGESVEMARQVKELQQEVEKVRKDFVASDTEVARLSAELDIRTRALEESEGKVGQMNYLCRRQVGRMLKKQRGAFKKVCKKQSRRAVRVVRGYLDSRRPWNRVDKLLSQAREAERILLRLQSMGVPIPDAKVATLTAAKEKHLAERAQLEVRTLFAQDFEFSLPKDLGVPNLDQIDFSAGFAFGDEEDEYWGVSSSEEDEDDDGESEGSEEGEGEEEEEEEEGEEEREAPLVGKGSASGSRPVEGEVVGAAEDQSALEKATAAARPEEHALEEVPPAGEETSLTAEVGPSGVQLETGARVEGEQTPPAAGGATSVVPEERERTPPTTWGAYSGVPEEGEQVGGGLREM